MEQEDPSFDGFLSPFTARKRFLNAETATGRWQRSIVESGSSDHHLGIERIEPERLKKARATSLRRLPSQNMSQAGSQAWAFYREVAKNRTVWTIRDGAGFPAPATPEGRAQPFWSSLARVRRIIRTVPAYSGFEPYEISWTDFCERWVPGLTGDNVLVGVNWSGARAVGYDMDPARVQQCVEALIERPSERAQRA